MTIEILYCHGDDICLQINLISSGYSVDPESIVQEQALGLVRNLVDGCLDSVGFMFAEDAILLEAVGRQLKNACKAEIGIQVKIFRF